MERRVRWKSHARCEAGEKSEDYSRDLPIAIVRFYPLVFDKKGKKFTDKTLEFYATGDTLDELEKYGDGDNLLVDVELKFVQFEFVDIVDEKKTKRKSSIRVVLLRSIIEKLE